MLSAHTHRSYVLAGSLILLVLIAMPTPLGAQVSRKAKPLVALAPIVDLNPKPATSWLPPSILWGLTYTFRKLSSIELLDQADMEKLLQAEELQPGQEVDDQRAVAIGRKLNADLMVAVAYEVIEDEKVSLSVRLIEPKSDKVNKPMTVEAPIDRLLYSLATIALRAASKMKYDVTSEEHRSVNNPLTFSFRSFYDYRRALSTYDPEAGTGNLSEAMALLTNAVVRDPRFSEARFLLGLLAARQGRSEQAATHLQQLVQDNPAHPNSQHNLGLARLNRGDYSVARGELLKAYQTHPRRANILNDLALAAYYLKDYESARSYLTNASELAPTSSVIWNNMGIMAYAQGAFTEGQQAYAKAVQHNPKSVTSHYNLGLTYLQLAEMEKAKEAFQKTLELDPRHAKTYYSLALIAEGDGTGKAAAYWKKYLELAKADPAEQPFVAFAQGELEKQPSSKTPQP